jgi:hypothetical protein
LWAVKAQLRQQLLGQVGFDPAISILDSLLDAGLPLHPAPIACGRDSCGVAGRIHGPLAKVGRHGCTMIGFQAIAGSCSWLSSHQSPLRRLVLGST